jgi:hypothetical protein
LLVVGIAGCGGLLNAHAYGFSPLLPKIFTFSRDFAGTFQGVLLVVVKVFAESLVEFFKQAGPAG